ncbi:hypothetical protein A2U01_0072527, partial [Trifolium medium]|nr:hypothetical protein [Trifolium medium]
MVTARRERSAVERERLSSLSPVTAAARTKWCWECREKERW